jgi:superfamily II DNA or RNA helicase
MSTNTIQPGKKVSITDHEDLGVGEVLRIIESGGVAQADVAFENGDGRKLETFPLHILKPAPDLYERLMAGDYDPPLDFLLKQLAYQFPLANTGGELSNSRTDLLPHQILLTHDVVAASRRRLLIADEVGLGKTIETGMIVRELVARIEADRVLIICPAGLIRNWRDELRDCFRLHFEVLGEDFVDRTPEAWEHHRRVIASIDTLKRPQRMGRLLAGPRWDMIIFDEAHHVSRTRTGNRTATTQNYRLAESLRGQTRDMLFLSATPHQGNAFQFWALIHLLDDQLFDTPESMLDHRGLLNRVMFRRTKREVTDAEGKPIFMRRQVRTQKFPLAAREQAFYEHLTEYLREGYNAAGIGQEKTTSQQRAIGFVMATFQKIMASSPRAIRQALRRRLLALLAKQQMGLEARYAGRNFPPEAAERIVRIQEEMRRLAADIHRLPPTSTQLTDADAHIAQVKQRLARRAAEEITNWSLDNDEENDEAVYADADIPNEIEKVRELVRLVPEGTDRKFDTLVRAIESIRREHLEEKFVIFTQYLETLEFLREELGRLYGLEKIVTVKGGPLEDKIASIESFWKSDGAQFLVSTSAGGEGINLQVCHILFNYDMPWNPMAVEQRIGRIHRYGQRDTAQVYNLVAEDTVEERIYSLLDQKLFEIAQTIGKVDPVTGDVVEDFRSEILGFLGSSPNYQELYKTALIDRDYQRTEREIKEAIEKARRASEALRALTQDLNAFNLEQYRSLRGSFTLNDIRLFVEKAIPRLGGAILPDGDFFRIETPEVLQRYPNVAVSYRDCTFDRRLAMRRRKAQLLGLGHPLVDALVAFLQSIAFQGDVACLPNEVEEESVLSVRLIIHLSFEDGRRERLYKHCLVNEDVLWREAPVRFDLSAIKNHLLKPVTDASHRRAFEMQAILRQVIAIIEAGVRANTAGLVSMRTVIVGYASISKIDSACTSKA